MSQIQILGTGCPKCKQLANNAEEAVSQLGLDIKIEKVTDINEILEFGVMLTPGLVINGEVKSVGKVLSPEEIKNMLQV